LRISRRNTAKLVASTSRFVTPAYRQAKCRPAKKGRKNSLRAAAIALSHVISIDFHGQSSNVQRLRIAVGHSHRRDEIVIAQMRQSWKSEGGEVLLEEVSHVGQGLQNSAQRQKARLDRQ
jgi:hypothetical protein